MAFRNCVSVSLVVNNQWTYMIISTYYLILNIQKDSCFTVHITHRSSFMI